MHNESYENFQYNSCISRGICSISPETSALQTVIVLYLRLFATYLKDNNVDKKIQNLILNTISITIYNPDFNVNSFNFAIKNFKSELPKIVEKQANSEDFKEEKAKALELFNETSNTIDSIRFGEKILNRALENIPSKIRDLYNIILVVVKSISINLLDLESFDKEHPKAFSTIIDLLSRINLNERNVEVLKSEINKACQVDIELMKQIREVQEERYGKQRSAEVSYSTEPNKAVLVVGSNIREVESILEKLEKENIDIYTHDEMMLAHTFPEFLKYPHLKGQFGQGIENCLLDFATFPGPIILTKHSLHNIENFYRGRLFTTDYTTSPKGIIKIENNDFSGVIKSANESKGFKRGKQCESITIGFDFEKIVSQIQTKIDKKNYNKVFIIGLDGYSLEQKAYFEKLIKLAPKNTLIISFSYNIERDNLIHINACFDSFAWIKFFDCIREYALDTTIFVPKCERNTISQILYFTNNKKTKVYIGKCTPIILNPSLISTLQDIFGINSITTSKKDLEEILKDK